MNAATQKLSLQGTAGAVEALLDAPDHTPVRGTAVIAHPHPLFGGTMRVNKAGCLDRCAGGPVAVVYPEGTWYTYVDQADIDEIVDSHLDKGQVVTRLLTPAHLGR